MMTSVMPTSDLTCSIISDNYQKQGAQNNDVIHFAVECLKKYGMPEFIKREEGALSNFCESIEKSITPLIDKLTNSFPISNFNNSLLLIMMIEGVEELLYDYSKAIETLRSKNDYRQAINTAGNNSEAAVEKSKLDEIKEEFRARRMEGDRIDLPLTVEEANSKLLDQVKILMYGIREYLGCQDEESLTGIHLTAPLLLYAFDYLSRPDRLCWMIQKLLEAFQKIINNPKSFQKNTAGAFLHDEQVKALLSDNITGILYSLIRIPNLRDYVTGIKTCARTGVDYTIDPITEAILTQMKSISTESLSTNIFQAFRDTLFAYENGEWKLTSTMPDQDHIDQNIVQETKTKINQTANVLLSFSQYFVGNLLINFSERLNDSLIDIFTDELLFKQLAREVLIKATNYIAIIQLDIKPKNIVEQPAQKSFFQILINRVRAQNTDPENKREIFNFKDKISIYNKTVDWENNINASLKNSSEHTTNVQKNKITEFIKELTNRMLNDYVIFNNNNFFKTTTNTIILKTYNQYVDKIVTELVFSKPRVLNVLEYDLLKNIFQSIDIAFKDYTTVIMELRNNKTIVNQDSAFIGIMNHIIKHQKQIPFKTVEELDKLIEFQLFTIIQLSLIKHSKSYAVIKENNLANNEPFIKGLASLGLILINFLTKPENINCLINRFATEEMIWEIPKEEQKAVTQSPFTSNKQFKESLADSINSIFQSIISMHNSTFLNIISKPIKLITPKVAEFIIKNCNDVLVSPYREKLFLLINNMLYQTGPSKSDRNWKCVDYCSAPTISPNLVLELLQNKVLSLIKAETSLIPDDLVKESVKELYTFTQMPYITKILIWRILNGISQTLPNHV